MRDLHKSDVGCICTCARAHLRTMVPPRPLVHRRSRRHTGIAIILTDETWLGRQSPITTIVTGKWQHVNISLQATTTRSWRVCSPSWTWGSSTPQHSSNFSLRWCGQSYYRRRRRCSGRTARRRAPGPRMGSSWQVFPSRFLRCIIIATYVMCVCVCVCVCVCGVCVCMCVCVYMYMYVCICVCVWLIHNALKRR